MRSLHLKHCRRNVSAARDENGVPHIAAPSWREALYGLGYMHALDRPTQMLFARAMATGRSAELIADRPELVETDRFFRRAGLYLRLDDEVRSARRRHVRRADRLLRRGQRRHERVGPLAADVGHRLPPQPLESAGGAAGRQSVELRRAGGRPAAERAADSGIDPGRRRRRRCCENCSRRCWTTPISSCSAGSKSPASFPTKRWN